jgi:hypothetical protein
MHQNLVIIIIIIIFKIKTITTIKPIDKIVDGIKTPVNPVSLNISCPNLERPFINTTLLSDELR